MHLAISTVPTVTHFTRSHHHTPTNSIKRIRADTSTSGDSPAEQEGSQEVTLESSDKDDGLEGVVHSEIQTTVDNNTGDRGTETTVQTKETVRGESLFVNIYQSVELTVSASLCIFGVVCETSTGVVQGVHEEQGGSTSSLDSLAKNDHSYQINITYTAGGQVAYHPLRVAIAIFLEREHGLVGIAESEIQGLGWEISDNVGCITTPQRNDALIGSCAAKTIDDAIIFAVKASTF